MAFTGFKDYFKNRLKDKAFVAVIVAYVLFCLVSAVIWCFEHQIRNLCMSLLFIAFALAIFAVEYLLKMRFGVLFTAGVLFIAVGSLLGSCFDFYTLVPFFDTILHAMSGVLFADFGFALSERLFASSKDTGRFFGSLVFAVCFSLAIAVVWEIFEYACTVFLGFDMMEDTYVTGINSYLLAGSHSQTVTLDGITQTIICYGDGQTYVIDGYLDLGLIDTLTDMMICTAGSLAFAIVSAIRRKKLKVEN